MSTRSVSHFNIRDAQHFLMAESVPLKWLVSFKGSLRWCSGGTRGHQPVKGTVTFQAIEQTPFTEPTRVVQHAGDRVSQAGFHTRYEEGIVCLLSASSWTLETKKIASPNTIGRAAIVTCTPTTVNSLQFTAKITTTFDACKLFVLLIERAIKEWNAWKKQHGPIEMEVA